MSAITTTDFKSVLFFLKISFGFVTWWNAGVFFHIQVLISVKAFGWFGLFGGKKNLFSAYETLEIKKSAPFLPTVISTKLQTFQGLQPELHCESQKRPKVLLDSRDVKFCTS